MLYKDILEHHGVKGMRWGIRNDNRVSKSSKKSKGSSDYRTAHELRRRGAHNLSNKQLKTVNERRNLESNFHRLNPTRIAQGLAAIASLLAIGDLGLRAYNQINSPGGQALLRAGKKHVGKQLKLPGF